MGRKGVSLKFESGATIRVLMTISWLQRSVRGIFSSRSPWSGELEDLLERLEAGLPAEGRKNGDSNVRTVWSGEE